MHLTILTIILITLFALPSHSQTIPIFRMNCGVEGANWPQCGWENVLNSNSENVTVRTTRINRGSPSGNDCAQIDILNTNRVVGYYWGWSMELKHPVNAGEARYLRWRVKIVSPVLWSGPDRTEPNEPPGPTGIKFVVFADGGGRESRVVCHMHSEGNEYSTIVLRATRNIEYTEAATVPADVWHSFQLKMQSAPANNATNGYVNLYMDQHNANENTPTVADVELDGPLLARGWVNSFLGFGYYADSTGVANSEMHYQLADFEYDDEFDPNWYIPSTSTTSASTATTRTSSTSTTTTSTPTTTTTSSTSESTSSSSSSSAGTTSIGTSTGTSSSNRLYMNLIVLTLSLLLLVLI